MAALRVPLLVMIQKIFLSNKSDNVTYFTLSSRIYFTSNTVTTSIMDLSSYRWLQKRDNKSLETRRGCCKEDIPLRATAVYYFLHAVFTIIFFCIFALKVTPLEKYLIVNVLVKIDNILRNPLTVVFAFKINDSTRQKNAAKERERRRNTEIQHALSRRMESIELQGKENIIDFRISN